MNIRYSKQAVKAIERMDRTMKLRIKNGIERLPSGDVAVLRGELNSFRLRVGDWRVIFTYEDDDMIVIKKIAPRGDVYKGV